MRIFTLALLILTSCGPLMKAEKDLRCPDTEDLLNKYAIWKAPVEFRIYGSVKFGPFRMPILLAKFDNIYTVKVPRREEIKVEERYVCVRKRCYLIPVPPENLVFGSVISGMEVASCSEGRKIMTEVGDIYEKTAVFEGDRLREYRIRNVRNGRTIKVLFGPRNPKGYFEEILFDMEGRRFKLLIEEVET